MEAIASNYLTKKFSTPKSSISNHLESATRVQGLLSNEITFVRTGPQNDPWLKSIERLDTLNKGCETGTKQDENSKPSTSSTPQKAQKRPNEQTPNGTGAHHVVIRNSGGRGQVGLTNIGNTCYFNAMLQCLTNCKPFYNYISSNAHDRSICKRGENCVLCLLKNFCLTYLSTNPSKKVVTNIVLRDLLDKMKTAVRRWRIHAQQSADEILSYIMNSMWEREMAYFGVKGPQTPMFNIFGTVIEQQYACSLCGQASISKMVEPTIILGLVNGDRRSVQDRLRVEYGVAETLSEPKDKCDGCGRSRTPRPTMKRVLKNLPMVLVVMLKRFYVIDGISHKINQFVQFPETLDLRPCMDTCTQGQNSQYRLTGVVEHWGKSVTDGHYVAYCKNFCPIRQSEVWFYLNDTIVRPIDLKDVLQKNAYLIFYTINGQSSRTVKIPPKIKEANGTQNGCSESKIRKITTPNGNASPKVKNGRIQNTTNGVVKIDGPSTNGFKQTNKFGVITTEKSTPQMNGKFSNDHNTAKKTDVDGGVQRKSLFGNCANPMKLSSKKILMNGNQSKKHLISKGLVPYESSDDDGSDNNQPNHPAVDPKTIPSLTKPKAATSSGWVVDKSNDAPSVASNSSQNSSVQGTSPGWTITENGHPKMNGQKVPKEKVTTLSYAPQMPPGFRLQKQKQESRDSTPQKLSTNDRLSAQNLESKTKDTAPFSYWGAPNNKDKDEREEYNEEIDSGKQKKNKKKLNTSWKGDKRLNPFQQEQDFRFKNSHSFHSNRIQKPLRHQHEYGKKFSYKGQHHDRNNYHNEKNNQFGNHYNHHKKHGHRNHKNNGNYRFNGFGNKNRQQFNR